jgi:hypothetical protein
VRGKNRQTLLADLLLPRCGAHSTLGKILSVH